MTEVFNTNYYNDLKLTKKMSGDKDYPHYLNGCGMYSLSKDTVSFKGDNKNKDSLFKKVVACVGVGCLAAAAIIFGKKKLDSNKAKRLQEEALKKAEEYRRQAEEAEQKTRLETEARLKSEAEARAEAKRNKQIELEKKARIEAEKNKEAERLAHQKVINKAKLDGKTEIDKAINCAEDDFEKFVTEEGRLKYNEDGTLNFNYIANGRLELFHSGAFNYCLTRYSEHDISLKIIDSVRKMEEAGVEFNGIKETLANARLTTEEELSILRELPRDKRYDPLRFETRIRANNEKMNYINERLSNEYPKDSESTTDFVARIIKDFESQKAAKQQAHIREVHSKIKYTDEPCVEYFEGNPDYRGPNILAAEEYSSFEGNGGNNEEFRKAFSTFPRYKSNEFHASNKTGGKIQKEYNGVYPLVRWMHTPSCEIDPETGKVMTETYMFKTSEEFVERFKVGEDYVIPTRQSCSKIYDYTYGDNNYCDAATDLDIKFVFIPKSKNGSRAVDIGNHGYKGHGCEAIYLPGERFTVIDKRLEEYVNEDKKAGESLRSTYRWIIELQEK